MMLSEQQMARMSTQPRTRHRTTTARIDDAELCCDRTVCSECLDAVRDVKLWR